MVRSRILSLTLLACTACYVDAWAVIAIDNDDAASSDGEDEGDETTSTSEGDPLPDIPGEPLPEQAPECMVDTYSLDGPLPCELAEPSESLDPIVARLWPGVGAETSIVVTPLVANLDDDNNDGHVDVCDAPDIVVAAVALPPTKHEPWPEGHLHIIDGRDGDSTLIDVPIDAAINPALGDLDGDGAAEIIAAQADGPNSPYDLTARRLVAIRANGDVLWTGEAEYQSRGGGAIALADLDNDGSVEILAPNHIANAEGELLWAPEDPSPAYSMPVAVDLDGDDDLEVLFGGTAYDHAGNHLFDSEYVARDRGAVAVANFDGGDEQPELYLQYEGEHGIFDASGNLLSVCPTGDAMPEGFGTHPVTIRDLDSDGTAELIFSYAGDFRVLTVEDGQCQSKWSKKADIDEGLSTGTVFDLLGDGEAQTIYTDRSHLRIYDSVGNIQYQAEHQTRESIANPVVADVDGDGAAEILVVSSRPLDAGNDDARPALRILENADDRFAPSRRVWNQHTYHHSNVREDGRVPVVEQPHWQAENSFRTNRGTAGSELCIPPAFF